MADEADMRLDGTKGGGATSHASQRWFGAKVEAMILLVPAKRKKATSEKAKTYTIARNRTEC
jgi:hypothetical protein